MARKAMVLKQQRQPKYSTQAYTRCKIAADRMLTLESLVFAVYAFRELAYKGQIPGVRKASW